MNDKIISELTTSIDTAEIPDIQQQLNNFLANLFDQQTYRFASFSFPINTNDPLTLLEMCWRENQFQYYWEQPSNQFAIAASGEITTLTAFGSTRFNDIHKQFQALHKKVAEFSKISHPHSGYFLLGGFTFFDNIDHHLWNSFAPASFTLPQWMIIKNGKFTLATFTVDLTHFTTPHELRQYLDNQLNKVNQTIDQKTAYNDIETTASVNGSPLSSRTFDQTQWIHSVTEAQKLINKGTFDKIVIARDSIISRNRKIPLTQVIHKLRKQYRNCYNFMVHKPSGKTFLGATPERLASARNKLLLTEALAGSIGRGKTATEDTILEKQLSGNTKDKNEHHFVIKDIEERLAPFVKELKRYQNPEIKKLSNVQHLYTPIRARLNEDSNIFEVVGQLHPTSAVGGYPWKNAAPYIRKLEHFERGMYAGPVGWINGKGDLEFAVAIRSALFTEQQTHLFAGCGIVEDSDPLAEWEETNLKLKPMLSALQYD